MKLPLAPKETIVHSDGTTYEGANPMFSIAPPNAALGIMQPIVTKIARGRPFRKVLDSTHKANKRIKKLAALTQRGAQFA